MGRSVKKTETIKDTVKRRAPEEAGNTEKGTMHENAHGRKRAPEKRDNLLTSVLSILAPKKMDQNRYDLDRLRHYY